MNEFDMDLVAVRAFLADKEKRRDMELDQKFEQARNDCERIVRHIISRYAPHRIWQWGSLLDRSRFSEISDIDLALEGLPGPQEFFNILGDAVELTDFPVDLVELETVGVENAQYIRNAGRLIFEQNKKC